MRWFLISGAALLTWLLVVVSWSIYADTLDLPKLLWWLEPPLLLFFALGAASLIREVCDG